MALIPLVAFVTSMVGLYLAMELGKQYPKVRRLGWEVAITGVPLWCFVPLAVMAGYRWSGSDSESAGLLVLLAFATGCVSLILHPVLLVCLLAAAAGEQYHTALRRNETPPSETSELPTTPSEPSDAP